MRLILFLLITFFFSRSALAQNQCAEVSRLTSLIAPIAGGPETFVPACRILDGPDFEKVLQRSTHQLDSRQRLLNEELAFKLIGIIPDSLAYADCLLARASDAVNSFYDTGSRTVFLRKNVQLAQSVLLAEGIVSLRDRMFNLSRLLERDGTIDQSLAANALIHGDMIVLLEQALRAGLFDPGSAAPASAVPQLSCNWSPALQDLLLFPIEWGSVYAARLQQGGGAAAMERAFRARSLCTSDIIHSARFLQSGPFQVLSARTILSQASRVAGRRIYQDSAGQFLLQALLKHHSSPSLAIKAAKGWRGDVLQVFKHQSHYIARWLISFESEKDLPELIEALRAYSYTRYAIQISPQAENWQSLDSSGARFSLRTSRQPYPLAELTFQSHIP